MKAIIKGKVSDLKHRGTDDFGDGSFGASRGSRKHKGIDYECPVDAHVLSPVNGTVSKIGLPYRDSHLDYVEITDNMMRRHRVMYIESKVETGQQVTQETVIGLAQGVSAKYTTKTKFMKNHIHYEILDGGTGKPINPEK